ncbi:ABC transporter substrate-binding protein [Prevotella sp. OH937_COT-195]|uniref:ABC transporter substrate-binding protein n=1 Tax=Prevotella sp. OH937_COT-195 TaxID=2491051 RepID=UPI000F647250|nr:ABC transporter substrate-binding protein [Prevotella sp. OH937_COT-195]RRD00283.1 ABC transporter substrate-binding protein [Prevotella sp. OH937_COT-195]
MKKFIIFACLAALLTACRQTAGNSRGNSGEGNDTATVTTKYARGFSVKEEQGYRLLEIRNPQETDGNAAYRFALVPRGTTPDNIPEGCTVIETPVKSVICMTTQQLGGFIKLGALDFVTGIASAKRLFDKELKQRIQDRRMVKIGKEGNFNEEMILASQPDVILISLSKRGGFDKLQDAGVPLIPYMGYEEVSPLAQAEWIKFVGLLTGNTAKANDIFSKVERNYNDAKAMLPKYETMPSVLYGKMHGDNWYAMGGKSFVATIVNDAAGQYFMCADNNTGGVNIDFEKVYSDAGNADFWIIQNKEKDSFSYTMLVADDPRYADFSACRNKKVVCCDMNRTPLNELSAMEPDILLKDFIKAFHPEVLKDYTPKYYKLTE